MESRGLKTMDRIERGLSLLKYQLVFRSHLLKGKWPESYLWPHHSPENPQTIDHLLAMEGLLRWLRELLFHQL